MKLAPEFVNVLLLERHGNKLHQVIPDRGVCTIGTDHEVEVDLELVALLFRRLSSMLEPCCLLSKVCADQFVVEQELYIRHGLQMVEQCFIQTRSIHSQQALLESAHNQVKRWNHAYSSSCIIDLRLSNILSIFPYMNHATMHGKCFCQYRISKVG